MPAFFTIELLRRQAPLVLALIVACVSLVGCGADKAETPDAAGTVTTAPVATVAIVPTALSGSPVLGDVVWTNAVVAESNTPSGTAPVVTDTTIYAVFPIQSLPAGSQLVASWSFNDTSLDGLNSAIRVDHDQVDGWIEFHIQRIGTDPWPDGVYEVVVSDGTTEVQRASITIS